MKKILFIIGSLRKESFNKKLAEEVEQMLTGRATVEFLDYSDVPLMNQDIEFPAPEAVKRVRKRVAEADALWIFSPEYNYTTQIFSPSSKRELTKLLPKEYLLFKAFRYTLLPQPS